MIKQNHLFSVLMTGYSILKRRNNFVHNFNHCKRVFFNNVRILGLSSLPSLRILILSAMWHDVGQNDFKQQAKNHHIYSARLFKYFTKEQTYSDIVVNIILCHRNRGANKQFSPKTLLEKAFFDADKLDILHIPRSKKLIKLYSSGFSCGEFNIKDTLDFWENFIINGEKTLFLESSKKIFRKRIKKFIQFVIYSKGKYNV